MILAPHYFPHRFIKSRSSLLDIVIHPLNINHYKIIFTIAPCGKYPFIYYIWTQKVLQSIGIVFPCHPLMWWGRMEISMNFCSLGGYLCCWRIFVMDTPLKLPYLDTWRSRLISWLEVKTMTGQLTCLKVKTICHILKTMCFWRSQLVIWPPWLNSLSLSFWSEIYLKQHLICDSLVQILYISKLIKKKMRKTLEIKKKQCLQWAQVREFYFLLRLAITP